MLCKTLQYLTLRVDQTDINRSSHLEVFLYSSNLQENTHAEVHFQLLKSHFGMGVPCTFAAYLQNTFY